MEVYPHLSIFTQLTCQLYRNRKIISEPARHRLGLPAWTTVDGWMDPNSATPTPDPIPAREHKIKCPEIPVLSTYQFPPTAEFWKKFPSHPLPKSPTTPVNIEALKEVIEVLQHRLTSGQKVRAKLLVRELTHGATTPLTKNLPAKTEKNSPSVVKHGKEFTDTVASWVKKGYVAGPFITPPLDNFRSNSMLAVEQPGKIRAVMHLSSPEGESFNDAIDADALEQVHMSTARFFGYSVVECGHNCLMWKWDHVDAYKHIPAALTDLRLQGFRWLGRFFLEKQQVFGSSYAVSAYDRLSHTLAVLATLLANFPQKQVHRILDDLPVVDRAGSEAGHQFCAVYTALCEKVGVSLAPLCPNLEKSFEASTEGTVLGVRFLTTSLTWSLPPHKVSKILEAAGEALSGTPMGLEDIQRLMGLLNDFGQMCPFMRGFRFNLNKFLATLLESETEVKLLPTLAAQELKIWMGAVSSAGGGLPIPHRQPLPSLAALTFVSDAAGASFAKVNGRFIPFGDQHDRGAASISAMEDGPIWFCVRITWPTYMLLEARDAADHAYGCKSPTLEAIAMALPFFCCPEKLIGREILLLTDSEAVVFGWDSRKVTNDESASIIIQSVHIISAFLGCWVTVQHLPRMSTTSARLADSLTRRSSTKKSDLYKIRNALPFKIPAALLRWLSYPSEDWSLPSRLLSDVKQQLTDKNIHLVD